MEETTIKTTNDIAQAIYLASAAFLLLIIYYLFATSSVAFHWLEFLLPIGLLVKAFYRSSAAGTSEG